MQLGAASGAWPPLTLSRSLTAASTARLPEVIGHSRQTGAKMFERPS